MPVLTINTTGPLSLADIAIAAGYGPTQAVSLDDAEMRLLSRSARAGAVAMDGFYGAVRIDQTGTAGTAPSFVGFSSGAAGSIAGDTFVKGALMIEVGQGSGTCNFVCNGFTSDPGRTFIHGVAVKNNNGLGAYGFASEATYLWNNTLKQAAWVWGGGWNMSNGVGFRVFIYY